MEFSLRAFASELSPRSGPPRLDPTKLIPPGVGTAIGGKKAADLTNPTESLAVRDARTRDARGIPDVDYRGRTYSAQQKDRVYRLGDDPQKGFLIEEGESGFAAEQRHDLSLSRYNQEGLEFRDRNGEYWDVVSPRSYSDDGRIIFNEKAAIKSIKRHLLKGNVILDYGQLSEKDADCLRKLVKSLSESDKSGRKIVSVREGE